MADQQKSRVLIWVVVGGGAFFLFVMAVFTLVYLSLRHQDKTQFAGFGDKIAVIDLEGVILQSKPFITQLKKYADDDSIKAIIIHVNTPGGGAAASQEMYETVKRLRVEKKKRIVAAVETVGASGGYYVAVGTDKIYANPASIVGSIGVIAQWYNYGDLMRWAKIHDITLKSGELKDAGTPTREMTPTERVYMQGLIDDMFGQFVAAVAEGRKLPVDEVQKLASGRVWTGKQALPLKLVDQLGTFQDAVNDTAKAVGIHGEPTLVRPEKERHTAWDLLFGDLSEFWPERAKLMQTNVGFYYLWR